MRNILRLSAITAIACIPLVGCSDDDLVGLGPIGGSAGDAGSGGSSGSATGGRGGTDDTMTAGTGGTAGSGGTAGTAGTAGTGGAGGTGDDCTLLECGTDCVDPATTEAHCGACDRACSNTNASGATCTAGVCAATCNAGFADCSADGGTGDDDGCETDLNQNATCGTTCEDKQVCGTGQFCVSGVCTATCTNTECGSACVTLATSSDHCNTCDRACSAAGVETRSCVAGACDPVCNVGFGDCSVDDGTGPDDGCETELDVSEENCGACGRACGGNNTTAFSCTAGLCNNECLNDFGDCNLDDGTGPDDGCETELQVSEENCGACGRACDGTNTSSFSCTAGACAPICNAGFADCNLDNGTGPDDGCETNLNDAASCGTTCANRAPCGDGQLCIDGTCGTCPLTVCDTACVDTQTSVTACGECDRACDSTNTDAVTCTDGACVSECSIGFGDCNTDQGVGADGGSANDGCETDFNSEASCGTNCIDAVPCADGESCVGGVCETVCELLECGGECIDSDTIEEHCGACDRVCLEDANVTSTTCSAGICNADCVAGRADCSQPEAPDADDGCETNLNSNATCGTTCESFVPCTVDTNCVSGVCTPFNLVSNPGVESGLAPWAAAQGGNVVAATDQFNTGLRSAVTVGRDQSYEGVGVSLFGLVRQGATYNASGFMRVSAPSGAEGRFSARTDCPGNPAPIPDAADTRTLYSTIMQTAVSSTAWTPFSGTFTVPTAEACLGYSGFTVFFENADATLQIYGDDLVVLAAPVTP